jgi:DNA-binding IclR family transcriptional regulator
MGVAKAEDDGPVVGAVVNAIAILRHLAAHPQPAGVNAIARATALSPSSCFNILKTLAREDLVEFDPATKAYAMGLGMAALARRSADPAAAFPLARPLLEGLAEKRGATVAFWRLTASERLVILGFAESGSTTRIHMTVGFRAPMLVGAGGRCVAAALNLPDAVLAREFRKLRWENPPDLAAYRQQVADAHARGWSLDDGAFLNGVTTVGAAITDEAGAPRYVVTATVFRGQHSAAMLDRIGDETAACAAAIGRRLAI